MGFSRPEYWNELPFPTPGDLADPGIEPAVLVSLSPALAGGFFTASTTWEAQNQPLATDKTEKFCSQGAYFLVGAIIKYVVHLGKRLWETVGIG